MGNMTANMLEARKRWFVTGRAYPSGSSISKSGVYAMHYRNYTNGFIRCSQCMKWIDPKDPQEAKEICYKPGSNRRMHDRRYCDQNGGVAWGCSYFSTVPKTTKAGTGMKKHYKRY